MALIGGLTLNELAAKVIGYAILTGSIGLKVPQILAILSSKAVEGIEPISFYGEVPLMIMSVVYFYLEGYPFSAFGDTAFILVQNIILVILLWIYARPSIPSKNKSKDFKCIFSYSIIVFAFKKALCWAFPFFSLL